MLIAPVLTQRAIKGAPLTISDGDTNWQDIQNFLVALESQIAGVVNDNGTLALYYDDIGTINAFQINTAEWVVAPNAPQYQPAYFQGLIYFIRAANTNSGPSTLAVASSANAFLPAIPMLLNGAPLAAGSIQQGQLFAAVYDLASNSFLVLAGANSTSSTAGSGSGTGSSTVITPNLNTYQPSDVALPGANTAATYPHGFPVAPNGYTIELVCITANAGFTQGQHVPISAFFNASNQPAFEVQVNITNIIVTQGAGTLSVIAPTGGSIGTAVAITTADWRLRVSAFIFTAPNRYLSPVTALPGANSLVTLPHGLAVNPQSYVGLVNSVSEQGYNTGDFVPLSNFFDSNADPAFDSYSDSTNIYVEQNNLGTLTAATATLTFSANPGNGSTVTIGATTYTFQTSLVNSANNVHIGAAVGNTVTNLVEAINAGANAGTDYGTGTVANASVTAAAGSSTVIVTAITAGTGGNAVGVAPATSGAGNCAWGQSTLSGGVNAPQVICVSGGNIGTAQPITPANWTIQAFAFAPMLQANNTLPAVDFTIANPDGAFLYNNDLIVFNNGRISNQEYISSIDLTDNGVTQLQVLPNSNFTVLSQYNNLAPFRFNDGLDRLVWTGTNGIWSLVLGQFTNAATAATGTLTFSAQPANNDTVVIDGKTYTFQTVLTNVNGHVLLGANEAAAIANLQAAMTLGPGAGTVYAAATTLDSNFTAVVSGSTIVATASQAGTAGNSITTTASSANCSWGAGTLLGGAGNSLVKYTSQDIHNYKPVWVDQTASTADPDFYCVGSGHGAIFNSNAVPMTRTHFTGSAYVTATPFGTNLNLSNTLIVNGAAYRAFHNNNKSGSAVPIPIVLFQYNPVKKRIYVMDVETGYLFIFNIGLYSASNNITAWWNQADATRYPQLTFEKAIAISGAGSEWTLDQRDHCTVTYDLTTGVESGIVFNRTGNAATFGSVTFVAWQNNS